MHTATSKLTTKVKMMKIGRAQALNACMQQPMKHAITIIRTDRVITAAKLPKV